MEQQQEFEEGQAALKELEVLTKEYSSVTAQLAESQHACRSLQGMAAALTEQLAAEGIDPDTVMSDDDDDDNQPMQDACMMHSVMLVAGATVSEQPPVVPASSTAVTTAFAQDTAPMAAEASDSRSSRRAAKNAACQRVVKSTEALCAALSEQLAAGGYNPQAADAMAAFVQDGFTDSVCGSKYVAADDSYTAAGRDVATRLAVEAGMPASAVGNQLDQIIAAAMRKLLQNEPDWQRYSATLANGTAAATGGTQD
jgi:hypothetical protein